MAAVAVQSRLSLRDAATPGSVEGSFTLQGKGGPFPIGEATSLEKAQSSVSFPLFLPSSEEFEGTLSRVWVTTFQGDETPQKAALEFKTDAGTIVVIEQLREFESPERHFQQVVQDGISTARVEEIDGAPALVIQADTDADKNNPAYVEIVRDGVDINIYSDSVEAPTLVQLARTMTAGSVPVLR
jgi:hypothetical protein